MSMRLVLSAILIILLAAPEVLSAGSKIVNSPQPQSMQPRQPKQVLKKAPDPRIRAGAPAKASPPQSPLRGAPVGHSGL